MNQSRRVVTALFCDMVGSTEIGERIDPEALGKLMTRFFDAMASVIDSHGGTVEKFVGDAVKASFGVPRAHEDDALRAVRAAAAMAERVAALNLEIGERFEVHISVRIGINTGEIVLIEKESGQQMILGDAMNVAARLEELADPGAIVLGPKTYELVKGAVDARPMERVALKGKTNKVEAYELLRIRPTPMAIARDMKQPLVGRQDELSVFRRELSAAAVSAGKRLFCLSGEAGIGKSRFLTELRTAVSEFELVETSCSPYGESSVYAPIANLIDQMRGADDPWEGEGHTPAMREPLHELRLGSLVVNRLLQLSGLQELTAPKEELNFAFRRLVESIATKHPLLLIIEDIHWARSEVLELVEHLVDRGDRGSVVVLCSMRTEFFDQHPAWIERADLKLNLGPLDDSAATTIVRNLLEEHHLSTPLSRDVTRAAGGNPLFIEQLIAHLLEKGEQDQTGEATWGRGSLNASLREVPSLQALLAARLDSLTETEVELLQAAAVAGEEFTVSEIEALCIPHHLPGNLFEKLIEKDLIKPSPGPSQARYTFRHALIRDAAYVHASKEHRAVLHERMANFIRCHPEDTTADEMVGYHLEQACVYLADVDPSELGKRPLRAEAARYLATAGQRANARNDATQTANLLSRAVAILDERNEARLELLPDLCMALTDLGQLAQASDVIVEALDQARATSARHVEARAAVAWVNLSRLLDPARYYKDGDRELQSSISALAEFDDEVGLAIAWRTSGIRLSDRGRGTQAERALRTALHHAQQAGALGVEGSIRVWLGMVMLRGPQRLDHVRDQLFENSEWARSAKILTYQADTLATIGDVAARIGDLAQADECFQKAKTIYVDLGLDTGLTYLAQERSDLPPLMSDPVGRQALLEPARDYLQSSGNEGLLSTTLAMLANALADQGQYEAAIALAESSEAISAPEDIDAEVRWRRVRGKILACQGKASEVARLFGEALSILDGSDWLSFKADTYVDFSWSRRSLGLSFETQAQRALELYEKKGELVRANSIRDWLEDGKDSEPNFPWAYLDV